MFATLLSWLGGKLAGPLSTLVALLFAFGFGLGFFWQSARIEGWPLIGGGLKAQITSLQRQAAARDLADARIQAAALTARQALADAADVQAHAHRAAQSAIQAQTQTLIEKVPIHVSAARDKECVVPIGAVRLLDAAASGASTDFAAAHIAPGQPDDAASNVALSEAVALLIADLGIARQNADQLSHLEQAVTGK